MKVNIVFLESELKFPSGKKQLIEKTIRDAAVNAGKLLRTEGIINFTVFPAILCCHNGPLLIGRSVFNEWITFIVPPEVNLISVAETTFHELHHRARGYCEYTRNAKPITFIDALFSEGLAISFATENIPGFVSPYSTYNPNTLQQYWLPEVRAKKFNINYDGRDWFNGTGVGYRIGLYFVRLIFERFPYLNSVNLVKAPLEELLDRLYQSGINLK